MKIKDVMTNQCAWVSPGTKVSDAAQRMADQDIGFLAVGENDKLTGTLTDRDIVVRALAKGLDCSTTSVQDIMTEKVFYCFEEQTVSDVCSNLSDLKIRRLPVVDKDKRLVGLVSLGDLSQQNASECGEALQSITEGVQQKRRVA